MNETMGAVIARLRKEKGMTQEQLARALGISFQAVSKWENELSSPDISALPLLAEIFGVSIDALFGRESAAPAAETDAYAEPEMPEAEPEVPAAEPEVPDAEPAWESAASGLPWPDDDTLRAVLFLGRRLLSAEGADGRLFSRKQISFRYEGPALNVQSDFSVSVDGPVHGSVSAGGDVSCDDVNGEVHAGGDVSCDTVVGSVTAGGDVSCDDVEGSVTAGGDVTCDDVEGDVRAGGDVTCDTVEGSVIAEGEVDCDNTDGEIKHGKGFTFHLKL